MIRVVRIGTPRARGEGLRVGTVRLLPRGVKKEDYAKGNFFDVWLPEVAPTGELVAYAQGDAASGGAARHCAPRGTRQADELLDRLLLREPVAVPPVAARRAAARAWREGRYPAFRIPAAIPLTVTTNASRSRWSS